MNHPFLPALCALSLAVPAVSQSFEQQLGQARRAVAAERAAAKRAFDASAASVQAAASAPMDAGSESFSGTLKLEPGASAVLPGSPRALALADGPITLKYGLPGWTSVFSGERVLALSQGGTMAVLPLSRKAFDSFGAFATAADPALPAMLRGTQATRQTGQSEREARVSCSYSGYCYACGLKFNGEVGCGFGFHVSCSGHQQARQRVTTFETVQTVEVLSAGGGRRLATITGPAKASQKVETLETLSSCH